MEKQINSLDVEVCKIKVTNSVNMKPSSQLLNDSTKTNEKIDYPTSVNHSGTILSSLLMNKNSPYMKHVTTYGDGCKNERNKATLIDNNNTISLQTKTNSKMSTLFKSNKSVNLLRDIPLDAKIVAENETKNGFSEFSSNPPHEREESCIPVESDLRDILECPQFMKMEKKQYSNDSVNLDELNLSVSKILNSTKPNEEGKIINNKSTLADAPCSKTCSVNKDHSYHLPLPFENGNIVEIKKFNKRVFNSDEENSSAKKVCSSAINCLLNNKNDHRKDLGVNTSTNLLKSENDNNAEYNLNIQIKKQNKRDTLTNSALTGKSSDKATISSNASLIAVKGTCDNEKNKSIKAKESETRIVPTKTDDTPEKEKSVENTCLGAKTLVIEKKEQPQCLTKIDSSVVSEEVKRQAFMNEVKTETQVDQSSDPETMDVSESEENKLQNASDEKTSNKDQEIKTSSYEESPFVVETDYVCNECGAKLKTQNSLFTHKKIHISGAIITATAKKRKLEVSEENEVPKETKRKRGRPKLVRAEPKLIKSEPKLVEPESKSGKTESKVVKSEPKIVKTEPKLMKNKNSTETITVTPLKENVAKKVLRNRAQSDEMTQLKLKQSAKAVKENKISNNDKTPKSKKNLKAQKPVLTKVISNKTKITARSENFNNINKTAAKVESIRAKAKTKNCYSSSAANNLQRKFPCPDCGMKFKRNDHMKRHQLLHSEKSFQCRHCEMKFYRGDKLKLHTIKNHSVKVSTKAKPKLVVKVTKLPKKSVECHKCGIQFLRIVPPKTDKPGQSRRKISCCISCGAKMMDEDN